MSDFYFSSVSALEKTSANRTTQEIGLDYTRLYTTPVSRTKRIYWVPGQQSALVTGISGTIVKDFVSAKVSAGGEPVKNSMQAMFDDIDREIAAMTDEQLVAEILAIAGAWADNPELTEDGFVNSKWFRTQEEWSAVIQGDENDKGEKTKTS